MEDAATAEISRAQIWQWKHHGVKTEDDGVVITAKRISNLVREEVNRRTGGEDKGKWFLAGKLVSFYFVRSHCNCNAFPYCEISSSLAIRWKIC